MLGTMILEYLKSGISDRRSMIRNKILNLLVDCDVDTFEIKFTIDIITRDKKDKRVKVVGIKNNSLFIKVDNMSIPLGHAWLRSDMIPEVLDYDHSDINKEHKLNVKIKTYEWTDSKFEFTTI
jgi:hypothetical protein